MKYRDGSKHGTRRELLKDLFKVGVAVAGGGVGLKVLGDYLACELPKRLLTPSNRFNSLKIDFITLN